MAFADESTVAAYREAWDAWQKQLDDLHAVFLDGAIRRPDQLKGLLNREARAKEKYDAARLRLLGLGEDTDEGPVPAADGGNPFR